jgi:hypothetical protein
MGEVERERSGIMAVSPSPLNSCTSLKRAFRGEMPRGNVQDLKDDMEAARVPIFFCFAKLPDKYTVVDSQVRVQQIELTAQIHGIFSLSELATPSGESHLVQHWLFDTNSIYLPALKNRVLTGQLCPHLFLFLLARSGLAMCSHLGLVFG